MSKRFPNFGRVLAFLLLGAAMPAAGQPVPPPFTQLRTDCTRPQYASDNLVCADAELRALDAEVAALASVPFALAPAAIWEDQASWMRRRSLCAFKDDHRGCLVAAYADRRAVLTATSAPATQPRICNGTWKGFRVTGGAAAPGMPISFRQDDLLLGVATPANPAWPPMLAWQAAGRGIKIRAQDGRQFKCLPAPG